MNPPRSHGRFIPYAKQRQDERTLAIRLEINARKAREGAEASAKSDKIHVSAHDRRKNVKADTGVVLPLLEGAVAA